MESTSERKLLQESLARLLKDKCPSERVRTFIKSREIDARTAGRTRSATEGSGGCDVGLWKELGQMGFLGLVAPSEWGGMGGSAADLMAVQTEMGRRLVPLPYLQHVSALFLLAQIGAAKPFAEVLKKAVSGEVRLSLPLGAESLCWSTNGREKSLLPYGAGVDYIVAAGPARGKVEVRLIPTSGKGIALKKVESFDLTQPLFELKWASRAAASDLRFQVPKGRWVKALAETQLLTTAAICAEILGGAEEALRLTIEYTKARVQFDRPIGTFQAVQHKAASAGILLEGIRSFVAQAATQGLNDPSSRRPRSGAEGEVLVPSKSADRERAVQMAKAYASDAYLKIVETGLQLHGGIGYTWEHDIHLYLRHAKRCGQSHGDPSTLRALHVRAIR